MAKDPSVRNIFAQLPLLSRAEELAILFDNGRAKIERIVSRDYASPPGFWYDQQEEEWVMLVRGSAAVEFAGGRIVELIAGDYLTIPAHTRHRVARTDAETIWLAMHLPKS